MLLLFEDLYRGYIGWGSLADGSFFVGNFFSFCVVWIMVCWCVLFNWYLLVLVRFVLFYFCGVFVWWDVFCNWIWLFECVYGTCSLRGWDTSMSGDLWLGVCNGCIYGLMYCVFALER